MIDTIMPVGSLDLSNPAGAYLTATVLAGLISTVVAVVLRAVKVVVIGVIAMMVFGGLTAHQVVEKGQSLWKDGTKAVQRYSPPNK